MDEECARRVAAADAQARSLAEQGPARGARRPQREARRRRAAARRRARESQLERNARCYDELRLRARRGARAAGRPRVPEAARPPVAGARVQLGPDAAVEIDPPDIGGVVGRADGRSVDYSLPALAERAVEDLDGRLEALWR